MILAHSLTMTLPLFVLRKVEISLLGTSMILATCYLTAVSTFRSRDMTRVANYTNRIASNAFMILYSVPR